jgi:hypothetical protein
MPRRCWAASSAAAAALRAARSERPASCWASASAARWRARHSAWPSMPSSACGGGAGADRQASATASRSSDHTSCPFLRQPRVRIADHCSNALTPAGMQPVSIQRVPPDRLLPGLATAAACCPHAEVAARLASSELSRCSARRHSASHCHTGQGLE